MSVQVKNMFAAIARKYDLMNDILSFGVSRSWRRKLVNALKFKNNHIILDCATGTGDLAFEIKKAAPGATVKGIDFTPEMIEVAKEKASQNKLDVEFSVADALHLPFEDKTFDAVTIAFGIRNVDSPVLAMEEMSRVTRLGGRVVILEFGQPEGLFSLPYKLYSRFIMPLIGKIIAKNKSAYEYLPQTAARFPSGQKFTTIMRNSGLFSGIKTIKLSMGIAYIYIGTVA